MDINLVRKTVKPRRKAHHKVRTGCSTCKTRRIKCDEEKPVCGRCKMYGAHCDILEAHSEHRSQRLLGPDWRAVHLDTSGSSELGMADLELMCHWDAATHATFAQNPEQHHFFRRNVVDIALRCDFVALSLLSLAALHLAHSTPARRSELTERALCYHNVAARKAIQVLPIPEDSGSEKMIENLFVFSTLTIFYTIACSERSDDLLFGLTIPEDSPDWLSIFFGTSHLAVAASSRENRKSIVHPITWYSVELMNLRHSIGYTTRLTTLRAKLDALDGTQISPALRETWVAAITELELLTATLHERPDSRDLFHVFTWLHTVPSDFMAKLRGPSPPQEALVIFYYYCMILEQLNGHWWLDGWATRLMQQNYAQLDDEHKTWIVQTII